MKLNDNTARANTVLNKLNTSTLVVEHLMLIPHRLLLSVKEGQTEASIVLDRELAITLMAELEDWILDQDEN